MQCTKCGADLQPGATVCPVCEERVVPTRKSVAAPRKPLASMAGTRPSAPVPSPVSDTSSAPAAKTAAAPAARPARPARQVSLPKWLIPGLIVAIVVGISGWVLFTVFSGGNANTPDAAALRMMNAYAVYDAQGMLDNMTHASLSATDQATFVTRAAEDKKTNNGKALLTDIKVISVTPDPKDPNTATVKLSEMILDPTKGTYTARTDTLSVVKQSGKWLVHLF